MNQSTSITPPVFVAPTADVAEQPPVSSEVQEEIQVKEDPFEANPRTTLEMIVGLSTLTLPPLGMAAAIYLLWGSYVGPVDLVLFVGFWIIGGLGITVGYHRYFTHSAFKTNKVIQFILGVAGSMAMEGSVFSWVDAHRRHHRYSDEELDPHSPHTHGSSVWGMICGFYHAHMGWLVKDRAAKGYPNAADIADPLNTFVHRTYVLWVLLGMAIPALIGGTIAALWGGPEATFAWGALTGFIWGGLARIFFMHHATWSVNSICHIWGGRPFKSGDHSRNNLVVALISFGEGWHNNHHAFPTSARHGLRWYQIDFSWMVIRTLELVGLASNVRLPSESALQVKKRV